LHIYKTDYPAGFALLYLHISV